MSKKSFKTLLIAIFLAGFFCSCENDGKTALLWTDKKEIAFYAQYYNFSQNKYKINVAFVRNTAEKLIRTKNGGARPDLVISSFLNLPELTNSFYDLDPLLRDDSTETGDKNEAKKPINKADFYPQLLKAGEFKNHSLILPVSFNIPAIIINKTNAPLCSNYLTIDIEELKKLAGAYNKKTKDELTALGFSPLWNKNSGFLILSAYLFGCNFRKPEYGMKKKPARIPVEWDETGLNESIKYIKELVNANGGVQAEDDFIYKYFFNSTAKLIADQRILFAYSTSKDYFNLYNGADADLDFRWITSGDVLPVIEDWKGFAILKKSRSKAAAEDFAAWFFNEENQDLLLEESRKNHLDETVFGIVGGLSAMRTVSESVFPKYYKELLSHIPPGSYLHVLPPAPENWPEIKEFVIIPYILDEVRSETGSRRTLPERLSDWQNSRKQE